MTIWDTLSPPQRRLLRKMANMERRKCWTRTYEWLRGRVLFEEWSGEGWEDDDGRFQFVSRSTTGNAFSVWIFVWWWRRLVVRRDDKIPKARLLR